MAERIGRPPILWGNVAFFALWTDATAVAVPRYVAVHGVTWMEVTACAGLWLATGLSITAEVPSPRRALCAARRAARRAFRRWQAQIHQQLDLALHQA